MFRLPFGRGFFVRHWHTPNQGKATLCITRGCKCPLNLCICVCTMKNDFSKHAFRKAWLAESLLVLKPGKAVIALKIWK